ncbi:MAG: polyribonucleotide nucleotidyltransferase [Candidatus Nealsonbacteria bacterium RIFCSPHIGHO2_12_FULL_38_18]|nr:MAG: polyribonucleotide nucleotidyltransferase [Candidatus Nealsonbacteria bacterium RIFCSPHIGHO2_12_FULL_38_18]
MKFELKLGEKILMVEINDLAEQASGSAIVQLGDTLVLAACVMSKETREDLDFFPLTVEYQEKYYAAGKIKGPRYIKRESRPSDEAICNSRLIDRAIRPLFPECLKNDVQVVATVLSWDAENDPDTIGLISASLALAVSNIPWGGPVAAVRVGRKEGKFILNPNYGERERCDLDILFAGVIEKGKLLVNMIEGGSEEAEDSAVLEAFDFAEKYLKDIVLFQEEIIKKIGKKKSVIKALEKDSDFEKEIQNFLGEKLEKVLYQKDKSKREDDVFNLENDLISFIGEKYPNGGKKKYVRDYFEKEIDRVIKGNILKNDRRPDLRKLDEVREIGCQVAILPRTHGSGLFMRGQTKALSILTLGAPGDQQILEGMEICGKKRYMHHYNFPPYCSGETGPMRGPGRREIGHGMLAEKAILPLIPSIDEFPYTIRVVTEILSSNGSTSMASVSSSSLALMDAGVPVRAPAAGIAIGLVHDKETGEFKILTDIQGPEDHYGEMDFKVAGTKKGITAIQMDVKTKGISREIMEQALLRANKARLEILEKIEEVIAGPRKKLSPFAPRIITIQINPEKIREVIGAGGKIINKIISETGATIDIDDTGLIFITAVKEESAKAAEEWIKNITREVKVGEIFEGRVERIMTFGAFVEILPGQDGLIHISKLSDKRVDRVEDIVNIGDMVTVKVILIDDLGRINLALVQK